MSPANGHAQMPKQLEDANRPTTVAMLVGDLGRGGAERVTLEVSKGLLARGCRVEIIECTRKLLRKQHELPMGITCWRVYPVWIRLIRSYLLKAPLQRLLKQLPRSKSWKWKLYRRAAGPRLRRKIASLAPHAVIAQDPKLAPFIAKVLAPMKKTPPIVGVLHNGHPEDLDGIAQRLAGTRATARAIPPKWAAVSPEIARAAATKLEVGENEIIDLTNGCDMERIARMSEEAKPTADADTVLWAHRHVPLKRGEDAIAAFAVARARRPMRLLMLGTGSEHARLRALADASGFGTDILLPGFTGNPYPDMAACGAFLLTSEREGLPLTLIEALSLGTFCVSTDCPHGPRHILNDPKLGSLAPVGDTRELAEAMLAALEMRRTGPPGTREFRARNARERFGMEAALDRYHRLVTSLRAGAVLS